MENCDTLVEVVLVSSVLLDGAQWPDVEAGEAEHALGTLHGAEQTNFSVNGHQLGPGDLVTAHGLVRAEYEPVLVQLGAEQLLRHVLPVGEVGGPAAWAGQQRPAHLPAAGAHQVGLVTAVQGRAWRSLATHHAHEE